MASQNLTPLTINIITKKILNNFSFLENTIHDTLLCFTHNQLNIQTKYQKIKNIILNDNNPQKLELFNIICKIQKTYFALNKFAYIIKYNKSKIVSSNDLYLIPLNQQNKQVMTIMQNNSKYLFHLNDLKKIINMKLMNNMVTHLNADPICIINPYTNVIFNKSTLYNIYFFFILNNYKCPDLFYAYFNSNFNLTNFKMQNEQLLCNCSINSFIHNSDDQILFEYVTKMIDHYNILNSFKKIKIHTDFPKDKLISIMIPYLKIYFIYTRSSNSNIKYYSEEIWLFKMSIFYSYNPKFGNQQLKIVRSCTSEINPKIIFTQKKQYNDNHVIFNNQPNFLESHISTNLLLSFLVTYSNNLTSTNTRELNFNETLNDDDYDLLFDDDDNDDNHDTDNDDNHDTDNTDDTSNINNTEEYKLIDQLLYIADDSESEYDMDDE